MTPLTSMAVSDLQNGDFAEEDLEMADAQFAALEDMSEVERCCVLLSEILAAPVADTEVKAAS